MFFCRIDDRYIHGQIGVSWAGYLQISDVLIANDALVKDPLACTMQKLSVPNLRVIIKDVDSAAKLLVSLSEHQLKKLLLIVNNPGDLVRIIDAGFPISSVNIGHTKPGEGKKEVVQYLNIGESDLEDFKTLQSKGVKINFQLVPSHKKIDIDFFKISF